MKTLSGKVTLVTGAGAGIGKAIATLFAAEGARVVLADIHEANIEAVAAEINSNGGQAVCFAADVTIEDHIDSLFEYCLETFNTIDVLVNNAGVMDNFTPVEDVTNELWNKVMGLNINAAFFTCRKAVKLFIEKKGGTIINIASIGGRAGCAYTASKHALIGLTKNIGYDYAQKGIRCNAIAPGGVNTNITFGMEPHPFGFERMSAGVNNAPPAADPDEIAQVALFLASEKSSYINGTVLTADGGWTAY